MSISKTTVKNESIYVPLSDNDSVCDLQNEDIHAESLIPGFEAADGLIRCIKTGETVPDIPIDVLNFSTRTYNCLYRARESIEQSD